MWRVASRSRSKLLVGNMSFRGADHSLEANRKAGEFGGAMGSRTPDLLIANETLYQLSYDPIHAV